MLIARRIRTAASSDLATGGAKPGPQNRIAAVAQLVEHVIRNDGVVGSSPISGTTLLGPHSKFSTEINIFGKSAR